MLGRGSATQMKRRLVAVKVPTAADQHLVVSMRTMNVTVFTLYAVVPFRVLHMLQAINHHFSGARLKRSKDRPSKDAITQISVTFQRIAYFFWRSNLISFMCQCGSSSSRSIISYSLFASFGAHVCLPRSAALGNTQPSQMKGGCGYGRRLT